MAQLKLDEDYTDIFNLGLAIIIILAFITAGLALILVPLLCFYLAALQLYAGIGFSLFTWNKRLIAKYTQRAEPFRFYLSVLGCAFIGIISLLFFSMIYLSLYRH